MDCNTGLLAVTLSDKDIIQIIIGATLLVVFVGLCFLYLIMISPVLSTIKEFKKREAGENNDQ